ncbi:hypothetical protein LTR09_000615 [Extremus antarcticus]|uniref:Uncharacterized protein n=1 Tax=Extremus antarcticus TaxID=702011 RepID=A0AAJ0GK48_9PEZI|nr:hypothetical protein LTR09_000615 [Extremus antarcticus]
MDLDNITPQPDCRLLALPAELRTHIWDLILIQPTHKAIVFPAAELLRYMPESIKRRRRFCANILRTCKQIAAEGTPILYGENYFRAHPSLLTALPRFLMSTFPEKIQLPDPITQPRVTKLIRRYCIHVRLDIDPRFTRSQAEESFSGVEELHIDVFQAMYGGSDFTVLKMFEDVRAVGRVSIEGSLGDGRYAAWLVDCMQQPVGTPAAPFHEEYVGGTPSWDAWSRGKR